MYVRNRNKLERKLAARVKCSSASAVCEGDGAGVLDLLSHIQLSPSQSSNDSNDTAISSGDRKSGRVQFERF